jgi:hypothetical protein
LRCASAGNLENDVTRSENALRQTPRIVETQSNCSEVARFYLRNVRAANDVAFLSLAPLWLVLTPSAADLVAEHLTKALPLPPLGHSVGDAGVFVAWEAEADEPLAVELPRRLL